MYTYKVENRREKQSVILSELFVHIRRAYCWWLFSPFWCKLQHSEAAEQLTLTLRYSATGYLYNK